jgi:hypothetical protein
MAIREAKKKGQEVNRAQIMREVNKRSKEESHKPKTKEEAVGNVIKAYGKGFQSNVSNLHQAVLGSVVSKLQGFKTAPITSAPPSIPQKIFSYAKSKYEQERVKPLQQRVFEGVQRAFLGPIVGTQTGRKFVYDIPKYAARGALSIGLETPLGKGFEEAGRREIKPEEFGIERIIGNEPIKGVGTRALEYEEKLKEKGYKHPTMLAVAGATGATALDLWISGGGKQAISEIAKSKSPKVIKALLKGKVADNLLDDLARQLVDVDKTDDVARMIKQFQESPLIQEARGAIENAKAKGYTITDISNTPLGKQKGFKYRITGKGDKMYAANEAEITELITPTKIPQPLQEGGKVPVYEGKIKGEYGSLRGKEKIQVGNLLDNATIIHEVAHRKYGKMPIEQQGALDDTLRALHEKYPGIFTRTENPIEDIAIATEEFLDMKRTHGKKFGDVFIKTEGGRDLARFFKSVIDESSNKIQKISIKERLATLFQPLQEGGIKKARSGINLEKADEFFGGEKPKGLITRTLKTDKLTSEAKQIVSETPTYKPITLKATDEKTSFNIIKNPQKAEEWVLSETKPSAERTATAMQLIQEYGRTGKYEREANLLEILDQRLRKSGQEIVAAKLWDKLSPGGVKLMAQRLIRKANEGKWRWQKDLKLTPDLSKHLEGLATQRMNAKDPAIVEELSNEISGILSNLNNPTILQKVSMGQTISQLLNVKTIGTRNPLGNEILFRAERVNKYFATPIDWARSKLTGGERMITFKTEKGGWDNYFMKGGDFWKGFVKGGKAGWKGIDPEGIRSQFDISGLKFKSKWNPLHWLEKSLGATIKSFDYAAFSRAKNQTIGEMAYLRATNEGLRGQALKDATQKYALEADENILKMSREYGKYITYQDDNFLSVGLEKIKRGLNWFTGSKEFGLGDFVAKYTRTLGALAMRGLEYGPAGFLKSAYEISIPFLKKGGKVNVREVELSLSRAITGTLGLTGMGYYLADKGILTGKVSKDKDVRAMQKGQGMGGYQINFSALKRFVLSRFDDKEATPRDGDKMYTYDWAQPLSLSIALGANLNQQKKEQGKLGTYGVGTAAVQSLETGVETMIEQPLASGLKRFFGSGSITQGIEDSLQSAPSSFTATFLNQVNAIADNKARETYDPNWFKEMGNLVKSRIPILAQTLPERVDVVGDTQQRYQDGRNSIFNVMVNPGFITTLESTPESKMVLDLFEQTGETKQFPRLVSKSIQDENGNTIQLSAEQYTNLQKYVGEKTKEQFTKLAESSEFQGMNNVDKVNKLTSLLTAIGADAKKDVLGIGKGSGQGDEAFMSYIGNFKNLSDEDFKSKVVELKDQGGDQAQLAEQLNKYRQNDVAKQIGLNTSDEWSNVSTDDKIRFLEGKDNKEQVFNDIIKRDVVSEDVIRELVKRNYVGTDEVMKQDLNMGIKALSIYKTMFEGKEATPERTTKIGEYLSGMEEDDGKRMMGYVRDHVFSQQARDAGLDTRTDWMDMTPENKAKYLWKKVEGKSSEEITSYLKELGQKGSWNDANGKQQNFILPDSVGKEFMKLRNEAEDKSATTKAEAEKKADELGIASDIRDEWIQNEMKITSLGHKENILSDYMNEPTATLASVNIGKGAGVGNNNPLNIKIGGATRHWIDEGLAEPGSMGRDGGQFIKFKDAETGLKAAKELLFGEVYSGLSVESAMRKWSNRGYGAEAIGLKGDKKMSQLTNDEKEVMVKAMAWRESSTTFGDKLASNPPVLNTKEESVVRAVASGKMTASEAKNTITTAFKEKVVKGNEKVAQAVEKLKAVPPVVPYSNIGYIPPEKMYDVFSTYGLIAALKLLQTNYYKTPNLTLI